MPPQRIDRADILPVALELVSIEALALTEHHRNDILAKVMVGIRILDVCEQQLAQSLPAEDVDTHRSEIALRLSRLLLKLIDASVLMRVHDTETAPSFIGTGITAIVASALCSL